MSEHADPSRPDRGLHGLISAVEGILALLIFAEGRAFSAQIETEAEKTRRHVAEGIAKANELAAVNSIRIDHLDRSAKPPDSPPAN